MVVKHGTACCSEQPRRHPLTAAARKQAARGMQGSWARERQVSHGQSHMADDEMVNVCFAGRAAIQEEGEDGGPNRLGGLQSEGSV